MLQTTFTAFAPSPPPKLWPFQKVSTFKHVRLTVLSMLADIKWLFNFNSLKSYYENIDTFQLESINLSSLISIC